MDAAPNAERLTKQQHRSRDKRRLETEFAQFKVHIDIAKPESLTLPAKTEAARLKGRIETTLISPDSTDADFKTRVQEIQGFFKTYPFLKATSQAKPAPAINSPAPAPTAIQPDDIVDLLGKTFPQLVERVEGILLEGLGLLVGKPKVGKSFFALSIAVAVAYGGKALGQASVKPCAVLYLGLEDSDRRFQRRIRQLIIDGSFPRDRFFYKTTWPKLDQGGADSIAEFIRTKPDVALVIIDVLAKVKTPCPRNADPYAWDYAQLALLKQITDTIPGLTILLVHHTRKAASDDPFELIHGSQALAGATDFNLILTRKERGGAEGSLWVSGKDVEEAEHILNWDDVLCQWTLTGEDPELYGMNEQRRTIYQLLKAGPLSPKEVANRLGKNESTTRTLLQKMLSDGQIVKAINGKYRLRVAIDNVDIIDSVDSVDSVDKGDDTEKDVTWLSTPSTDSLPMQTKTLQGKPLTNSKLQTSVYSVYDVYDVETLDQQSEGGYQ